MQSNSLDSFDGRNENAELSLPRCERPGEKYKSQQAENEIRPYGCCHLDYWVEAEIECRVQGGRGVVVLY